MGIVFTLSLLSFDFGSGEFPINMEDKFPIVRREKFPIVREEKFPIVREDNHGTGREDELASNVQDLNFLDKYDQDQQILRDVDQENEDIERIRGRFGFKRTA